MLSESNPVRWFWLLFGMSVALFTFAVPAFAAPQAAKVRAIWSSSSTRSVTITNVQLPGTLRSTFCAKNAIE